MRRQGQHAAALAAWDSLRQASPGAFLLVASDYAASALACGREDQARAVLSQAWRELPAVELLQALQQVDGANATERLPQLLAHLQQHPSLSAAQLLLEVPPTLWTESAWTALRQAVAHAAKPPVSYTHLTLPTNREV